MFNLFKKKKEDNKRGDQYLSLKVREVVKETSDTVTIYFEQPEPYLDYKPGQYLSVILELGGKEVRGGHIAFVPRHLLILIRGSRSKK
jgi:ring-1,2-phenylacetyl-CoA epoxidase subunit PaaE